jgi:hypothetical protein
MSPPRAFPFAGLRWAGRRVWVARAGPAAGRRRVAQARHVEPKRERAVERMSEARLRHGPPGRREGWEAWPGLGQLG